MDTRYIEQLIKGDLGCAEDNLHRAKAAARHADVNAPYGESGTTLRHLIDGYQQQVDKAKRALKAMDEL